MRKNHKFKLIDGYFDPLEAKSLLFNLINSKIYFHSMESFGITVRTSGDISFHEKRIKELTKTNFDITDLLHYADKNKFSLLINGNIEIKLINDSKSK